jgi:exonuclease SbcC
MRLLAIHATNFMCYSNVAINLADISSAIIVGSINGSSLRSNTSGKSTLFRIVEFTLFGEVGADPRTKISLNNLVRRHTEQMTTAITWQNDSGEVFRIIRNRTVKGTKSITLLQAVNINDSLFNIMSLDKYGWKDLSSRRDSDTEETVSKLVKMNYKTFLSTTHFTQRDDTGLATTTPENRKKILKEALDLLIYSKLEKRAKDKLTALEKQLIPIRAQIDAIGDTADGIARSKKILAETNISIISEKEKVKIVEEAIIPAQDKYLKLNKQISVMESSFKALEANKVSLETHIKRCSTSIEKSKNQIKDIATNGKTKVEEIKQLKAKIAEMTETLLDQGELAKTLEKSKEQEISIISDIKSLKSKLEELRIPLPEGSICKHCRSVLSDIHRAKHQEQIDEQLAIIEKDIILKNKTLVEIKAANKVTQDKIDSNNKVQKTIAKAQSDIENMRNSIVEYKQTLASFKDNVAEQEEQLAVKVTELESITASINQIDRTAVLAVQAELDEVKHELAALNFRRNDILKDISNLEKIATISSHDIQKHTDAEVKKQSLIKSCEAIEDQIRVFPDVINAFSSTGIPNSIIQNILNEYQLESNTILNEMMPGLQLLFITEKESKGVMTDALEIKYFVNSEEFEFAQLSGAQKMSIYVALKIGLNEILQRIMGVSVRFVLIDEGDESLDKATVDTFANIIKMLEKKYTVLAITHNDRMRDHFQNIIQVDMNIDRVSTAKLL